MDSSSSSASVCGAEMCGEGTVYVDGQCRPAPVARCGAATCGSGTYLAEDGKCRVLPPKGTPLRAVIDAYVQAPDGQPKKTWAS